MQRLLIGTMTRHQSPVRIVLIEGSILLAYEATKIEALEYSRKNSDVETHTFWLRVLFSCCGLCILKVTSSCLKLLSSLVKRASFSCCGCKSCSTRCKLPSMALSKDRCYKLSRIPSKQNWKLNLCHPSLRSEKACGIV